MSAMCDTIPGELLICYSKGDYAGEQLVERLHGDKSLEVWVVESIGERVNRMQLPLRSGLGSEYIRLKVPVGGESAKANLLHFLYRQLVTGIVSKGSRCLPSEHYDSQLQVATHSILS